MGDGQRIVDEQHVEPRQRAPGTPDEIEGPSLASLAKAATVPRLGDLLRQHRSSLLRARRDTEHAEREGGAFRDLAIGDLDPHQTRSEEAGVGIGGACTCEYRRWPDS